MWRPTGLTGKMCIRDSFYSVPGGGGTGVADGAYGADALLPGDDSFLSAGRVQMCIRDSVFSAFGSPSCRYVINLNIGQTEKKVKCGFDRDRPGAYTCKRNNCIEKVRPAESRIRKSIRNGESYEPSTKQQKNHLYLKRPLLSPAGGRESLSAEDLAEHGPDYLSLIHI